MHPAQNLGNCGLRIGGERLSGRAVLAPLSGVTDVVFRRIAQRFGAALVVSEMVASEDLVRGAEEARLRAEGGGIAPHVVQIAGWEPGRMAEAARLAEAAGARIIDINMGCPAKRVTGREAGSALMRDLDEAARIIEAVVAAASVPVTVKMRLGWDDRSRNAAELARRAEALGAAAVFVHGRSRCQFFKGKADWASVAEVTAAVTIPVIANGDVISPDSAARCLAVSQASGVMIGRAALGRPWLVGTIAGHLDGRRRGEPPPAAKAEAAVAHYEGLLSLYGRSVGIRHARKHLAAYADRAGPGLAAAERNRLVTSEDPAVVTSLLRRAFEPPVRAAA